MLVLSDHGTPRSIARWLRGHTVVEALARGWDRLTNGELLTAAEEAGFDVLLTTDKISNTNKTSLPAGSPLSCWAIPSGPPCTATLIELWPQ
jgi:hypothetical protein